MSYLFYYKLVNIEYPEDGPQTILCSVNRKNIAKTARYHYRVCFGVPLMNLVPQNSRLGWLSCNFVTSNVSYAISSGATFPCRGVGSKAGGVRVWQFRLSA